MALARATAAPVEVAIARFPTLLGRRHGLAARPELVGTTPPGLPQLFASHATAMAAAELDAREHVARLSFERKLMRGGRPRGADAGHDGDVHRHTGGPAMPIRVALVAVLFVAELAVNYPVFLVFNVPPWATWAAVGGLQVTLLGAGHVIGGLLAGLATSKARSRRDTAIQMAFLLTLVAFAVGVTGWLAQLRSVMLLSDFDTLSATGGAAPLGPAAATGLFALMQGLYLTLAAWLGVTAGAATTARSIRKGAAAVELAGDRAVAAEALRRQAWACHQAWGRRQHERSQRAVAHYWTAFMAHAPGEVVAVLADLGPPVLPRPAWISEPCPLAPRRGQ